MTGTPAKRLTSRYEQASHSQPDRPMSNVIQMPDRRPCPPEVQTARDRCVKLIANLDLLAKHLDNALGQHLEGEAGERHRQQCDHLAQLLREARERAGRI